MVDQATKAILPENWKRGPGFSWGMISEPGQILAIAGQLGVPSGSVTIEPGISFSAQFTQCLKNIAEIVRAAGGDVENIIMLRAFVCDIRTFREEAAAIGEGWRSVLGRHFPAMTMVEVSRLLEDDALIELEGLAVIPKK